MDFLPLPVVGLLYLRWLEEERRRADALESMIRRRSRAPWHMAELERCAECGSPLGDDLDDDLFGEAGLPLCGECERARNFDSMWEADDLDYDR